MSTNLEAKKKKDDDLKIEEEEHYCKNILTKKRTRMDDAIDVE